MNFNPAYGETPLTPEEECALTDEARNSLLFTKSGMYEAEIQIEAEVADDYQRRIYDRQLLLRDILSDDFLRTLHTKLYGSLWQWAGLYRRREMSIGIDPREISVAVWNAFDNAMFRYENLSEFHGAALGVSVHAELVRIHPFVDGNGRTTRLLADLINLAVMGEDYDPYDWDFDRQQYISLLRNYDQNFDPEPLVNFILRR